MSRSLSGTSAADKRRVAAPPRALSTGVHCACGGGCPRCQVPISAPSGLTVGAPDDGYEREAERIATAVLSDATTSPPPAEGGRTLRRAHLSPAKLVLDSALTETGQALGEGRPLQASLRAFFEPRLGHDLSPVRLHTGAPAAESAKRFGARAYTLGNDIVFGAGEYDPAGASGRHLLAHELAHVVQQQRTPALRRTLQRTTLSDFKAGLEAMSADHKIVVDELFTHPKFVPLMNFLAGCPTGVFEFQVARKTTKVDGRDVDVFGGVSQGATGPATLTINPKIKAAVDNPLEVVDTVVHEFIHAAIRFRTACESKTNPFPLSADITDVPHDPELLDLRVEAVLAGIRPDDRRFVADTASKGVTTQSGGNLTEYFERNYGPAGSRPKTNYGDLNRQGLELITAIVADVHKAHPKIGHDPVSFDNVELMRAADLLATRSWWNATQRAYSMQLHKDRVARARSVDPKTFTESEYDMSAIQVVEFADSRSFDPNTGGGWGAVGGVWSCKKRSRLSGETLHTYVTGTKDKPPGGAVDYKIIQHT